MLKNIFKNSGIYIISQLSLVGLSLFLLPLYSYYLSPDQLGIYSIILSINSILTIFMLLAFHSSITSTFFDYLNDKKKLILHISSLFWFLIIWDILLIAGIYIISSLFFSDIVFYKYIYFILFISFFTAINQLYGSILRNEKKSIEYSFFSNGNAALTLILTILLLVYTKLGVYAPLIALLFVNGLYFFYTIYNLFKKSYVEFVFSKNEVISSLKYSLPFIPHLLTSFINRGLDKIILLKYNTLSSVGIYSMGSQVSGIINLIGSGVNMAWMPHFQELYRKDREKYKHFFGVFGTYFIFFISFLTFGLSLFSKEIIELLLSKQYLESYKVIPILSLTFVFFYLYSLNAAGLFAEKKSKKIAISTISGSIINIILNFLLIPKYGIYGAALSTLISQIITVILIYFQSKNIYKFPFEKRRMILIFVVFTFFYILSLFINFNNIFINILLKILLLLSSLVTFYFLGFLNKDELIQLKRILKKK